MAFTGGHILPADFTKIKEMIEILIVSITLFTTS